MRFGILLETGFRSDLTLALGKDKTEVKVHKIFLQLGSKVLDSKIEKCGRSGGGDTTNRLELEGVEDVKSFKMMLKYFYTGVIDISTFPEALSLLKMATDFEVMELREGCAIILKRAITEDNVLPFFEAGVKCGHKELTLATLEFICRRARRILKLPKFSDLPLECLIQIIQQDGLQTRNETEVFEAVYRWAEAECLRQNLDPSNNEAMRKIIDKPLTYVRLPLMDKEDLALYFASKKLLSPEAAKDVVWCFLVSQGKRSLVSLDMNGRFISRPRNYFISGRISRSGPSSAANAVTFEKAEVVWERLCLTFDGQDSLRLKEIGFPKEIFGTDTSGNVTWLAPCGHPHYFDYPCQVRITLTSWKDKQVSGVETLQRKEDDGSYWIPCKVMLDRNVRYEFTINFMASSACYGHGPYMQCDYPGLEHVLQRVTNFAQFPLILNKYGGGGPLLDSVMKVRLERKGPNYHRMPITSGFIQHFIFDAGEYDDKWDHTLHPTPVYWDDGYYNYEDD